MIKTGFFTADDLHTICNCTTIQEAKSVAESLIQGFVKKHPKTKHGNIAKAMDMVTRSTSVTDLGISAANFMLSHPSENLSMNKGMDK